MNNGTKVEIYTLDQPGMEVGLDRYQNVLPSLGQTVLQRMRISPVRNIIKSANVYASQAHEAYDSTPYILRFFHLEWVAKRGYLTF